MDLNNEEVRFLHQFIGHADIRLFAIEDFSLAISLHERLHQELRALEMGGTIQ